MRCCPHRRAWACASLLLAASASAAPPPPPPPPPPPVFTCTNFTIGPGSFIEPAFLSNGLVGFRPGPMPFAADPFAGASGARPAVPTVSTLVSGWLYREPDFALATLAPAPFPLETDVIVNGVSLLGSPQLVTVLSQTLDLGAAELRTELVFADAGAQPPFSLAMSVTQAASRTRPTLALMHVDAVATPATANVTFESALAQHGTPGVAYNWSAPAKGFFRGFTSLALAAADGSSALGIVVSATQSAGAGGAGSFAFDVVAAVVSSPVYVTGGATGAGAGAAGGLADPLQPAWFAAQEALYLGGAPVLLASHRAAWADLWAAARPVLSFSPPSSADDQAMLDAAFFALHQGAHPASLTGVPCYGLSQTNEAYSGAIFHDLDLWMLKAVALAHPASGAALARFRWRTLPAALALAARRGLVGPLGRRAAAFGWTVEMTAGAEATRAGDEYREVGITPSVAIGAWEAVAAAGAPAVAAREAWPALAAACEWVLARGAWTARGFEMLDVEGIDESLPRVNNSAFVNLASMMALERCLQAHEAWLPPGSAERDPPAAAAWAAALAAFVLNYEGDVLLPFDGARVENATRSTWSLGGLQFLLPHGLPAAVTPAVLRATADVEDAMRLRFPGPCLSEPFFVCAPFAVVAAAVGNRSEALFMLRGLWVNHTLPPFRQIREYANTQYATYVTNAGSLLSTVYSMTGLELGPRGDPAAPGSWLVRNASLPEGWDAVSFGRVWLGGQAFSLDAQHGSRATLTPLQARW